jgi:hypothetical protein
MSGVAVVAILLLVAVPRLRLKVPDLVPGMGSPTAVDRDKVGKEE